ncbi:hypothetical protein F5148DRAFT_1283651 [Russula earlei]|uniref:Uncharacterized protein n=1 Tax=Russula earlei TaxID=71964 RepID=A0ACC0UAR7_9AGAM|nr:hypothetical protein F5148DRAFT_1283651 [Russula earlei]
MSARLLQARPRPACGFEPSRQHQLFTPSSPSKPHLQQSITEDPEGTPFPSYIPPRGREFTSRASSPLETTSEDDLDSDDEDDVLILSDETSSVTRASSFGASPPIMRARSLGDMDLDLPEVISSIPPELSHTVASSSTSSLLSLSSPPVMPSPSSREEKAIAALTLALASGAAGLNDYGAVREALGFSAAHADGASEVGEMWR